MFDNIHFGYHFRNNYDVDYLYVDHIDNICYRLYYFLACLEHLNKDCRDLHQTWNKCSLLGPDQVLILFMWIRN